MKGRWSLYWIVFLFAALFLGPTLILEGPQSLKPSADTLHAAIEQEQLRDSPNSPSRTGFPAPSQAAAAGNPVSSN